MTDPTPAVTFKKVQDASITFGDRAAIGHQPGHYAVLVNGERVGLIIGQHRGYMEPARWDYLSASETVGLLAFDAYRSKGVTEPVAIRCKTWQTFKAAKTFIAAHIREGA